MSLDAPAVTLENTYARELEGFYVPWSGDTAPDPKILRLNADLAQDLGIDPAALNTPQGAAMLTGGAAPQGATPLAMAYAGHQFGGFSPQLGDGRALLLGEVIDRQGRRRDLHLKGSGRTPFSRGGDGKAVLGPVLREYLMGEAMHALGIPTTRALAATTTGEQVLREPGLQTGAVLARVAASHLRVGTFQFFAARGETGRLRQLADYAIARHDPDLSGTTGRDLAFLNRVVARQARLIAQWMHVGFIHGVMNTDNMAISGETIDYGPCAFVDAYDPATVFSSIDRQGRYAYGNQPGIARWNLARLAETLLPFLSEDEEEAIRLATEAVNSFGPLYEAAWTDGARAKLGLASAEPEDLSLAQSFLNGMEGQGVDFTNAFRALARVAGGDPDALGDQFLNSAAPAEWLARWHARTARDCMAPATRPAQMNAANPIYIPRNHLVEAALTAAGNGDLTPFDQLLTVLTDPFTERKGQDAYAQPAPSDFTNYQTFCGT